MKPGYDKVGREYFYPLGDHHPEKLHAVWTGDPPRPIQPGEWYLSGAIIAAYCAKGGTTHAYHPAQLVTVTKYEHYAIGGD